MRNGGSAFALEAAGPSRGSDDHAKNNGAFSSGRPGNSVPN